MILISVVIMLEFFSCQFYEFEKKTRMMHGNFEKIWKSLKFKFERKKSFKVFLVPKKMSLNKIQKFKFWL